MLRQLVALALLAAAAAFVPRAVRPTARRRVPCAAPNEDDGTGGAPKKLGFESLLQLVQMGAGMPSLGELKKTNFRDNSKPDLEFELDANNFMDREGKSMQMKAKYFESGYVPEAADEKGPGFLENLMSGGKLQTEYDKRRKES